MESKNSRAEVVYPGRVDYVPEPIEPDPKRWVPPPLHVLPAVIRGFVEAVAHAKDIDPVMVLMSILAVFAAAIGNARVLRLRGDYDVPAVLWTAVVAGSGDGKSPAMDAAMVPVLREQARLAAEHKAERQAWEAAMRAWKLAKDGSAPPEPPVMPHIYVSDATVEALAVLLEGNPRGLLVAIDELAALAKSFGAYKSGKGGDTEFYLAAHGARAAKIDRKGGFPPTLVIPRAAVTITGTVQPAILARMLTAEMVACGFAARFLLAMPPARPRVWRSEGVSPDVSESYARIVDGLRRLSFDPAAGPRAIRPSNGALQAWAQWHDEMHAGRLGEDGAMRAALPKLIDAAARLALIFHCVDVVTDVPGVEPDVLNTVSMRAGIEMARWFVGETRRVHAILGESAGEEAERALTEVIRTAGGSVTTRELMRRVHRFNKGQGASERARAALQSLVDGGIARWEGSGKDARCVVNDSPAEPAAR